MRSFLFLGIPGVLVLLAACGSTVVSQQTGGAGTSSTTHTTSSGTGTGGAIVTTATATTGAGAGATTSTSTSTTTATATTSTSSGAGGGAADGDCKTSADCNGNPCAPLTPGGYLVCLSPVAEATSCQFMGPPNQCCTSADCPSGANCYPAGSVQACGGAFPGYNVCISDSCKSDAECEKASIHSLCVPAGAFGFPKQECLAAYCKTDADCTAKPGGKCVPIGGNPCCSLRIPDGLGCGYPGDCAGGTACPSGQECRLDTTNGTGKCQQTMPCPP